jgi:CRP/FNR family transcriptional regulator, cyclic AMP receptor protein
MFNATTRWNPVALGSATGGDDIAAKALPELARAQMVAAVLARVEFLQGLDPGVIFALAGQLHLVDVRRGENIYCQDDAADGLHVIIVGKVKICSHAADGREKLLEIRGPADVLGAVSVLDPGPRTATATAITNVCAATLDGDTLQMWMTEQPQITEQLLRLMARRLRQVNHHHLLAQVFDDVPGRVAKELLHLAQRFGAQQGELWRVKHDLTQTEIAQLVGATRESVNKALCDFAHRGWITVDGKSTLIHRPELLARRAG